MYRCFITAAFLCSAVLLLADIPLPPNVLNPGTTAEAWNVIRLTRANVARLLLEKRVSEVPEQISLCSPALRVLAHAPVSVEQRLLTDLQTSRAFSSVNTIAQSCMVRSQPDADKAFIELESALTKLESVFDAADVNAEIYYCTEHPEIVSTIAGTTCRKCAAKLRLRRIPYSYIYVAPGTPTVRLSMETDAPLVAGKTTEVKMQIRTSDDKPVTESDLLVVHTRAIHLLITDQALGVFQIAHPAPAAMPGSYTFSFTPTVGGPHRIWADIVPAVTGLQELPSDDIGGNFVPVARKVSARALVTTIDGFTFQLSFAGGGAGSGSQAHARQIQLMRMKVTDSSGLPVQRLEPFMSAFAQAVGFYDDCKTVIRPHPIGSDILQEDLRGGPFIDFKIYPPRSGFIRFYCQVRIDGRTITVPFSVNVVE